MTNTSELTRVPYSEDIKEIFRPLLQLKISAFSHVCSKNSVISGFHSNPLFMENYLRKKHFNVDIHMNNNCQFLNCLMWDNIEARGQTAQMLQDAAELQYNHIFTVIQKHKDKIDYYHFGTDIHNSAMNQLYLNNYDLLEKFINFFNERLKKTPSLESIYTPFKIDYEQKNTIEDYPFFIDQIDVQKKAFLKEIGKEQPMKYLLNSNCLDQQINLTPKELDYLPFIMQGYTAKGMANFFGVSYRTIEIYIANLKKKWQVNSKAELTRKLYKFCKSS